MRYGFPAATLLAVALLIDACHPRGAIIFCPDCGLALGVPSAAWTLEHHDDGSHTADPNEVHA